MQTRVVDPSSSAPFRPLSQEPISKEVEEEEDFAESVSDKIVQKPPQTQLQKPALSGCDDSKNILATLPQARGSSQQLDCIMAPLVHTSAPRAPLADDSDDASGPRHCGAAASVRSLAPILLEPANTPLTSLSQSMALNVHRWCPLACSPTRP